MASKIGSHLATCSNPLPPNTASGKDSIAPPGLKVAGLSTDASKQKPKRRSLNIFPRRGSYNDSDHNTTPTRSLTMNQSGPKLKRWRLGRKSTDDHYSNNQRSSGSKETIIHAVPTSDVPSRPTRTPYQSVERLPLPAPDTEHKPLPPVPITHSPSPSPGLRTFYQTGSVNSSSVSLTHVDQSRMSISRKARRKEEVIGVYKNGKVKWNSEPHIPFVQRPQDAFERRPDGHHTWSHPSSPASKRSSRPKIQVIIPSDQRQQQFPCLYHTKAPIQSAKAEFLHSSGSGRTMPVPFESESVPPVPPMPQSRSVRPSTQTSVYLEKMEHVLKPNHQRSESRPSDCSDSSSNASHSSVYSSQSSMTSIEDEETKAVWTPPNDMLISLHERPDSIGGFSIQSPVGAGIFDQTNTESGYDAVKPKRPASPNRQVQVAVPSLRLVSQQVQGKPSMKSLRQPSGIIRRSSSRSTNTNSKRLSSSAVRLDLIGAIFNHERLCAPSPTLSEAAHDLREHLSSITDSSPFQWDEWIASYEGRTCIDDEQSPVRLSTTVEEDEDEEPSASPGPPPALPKRSSKRLTVASPHKSTSNADPETSNSAERTNSSSPYSSSSSGSPKSRCSQTSRKSLALRLRIPCNKSPMPQEIRPLPPATVDAVQDDGTAEEARLQRERDISAEQAEAVILRIFESLNSIKDLYATAALNQGFRRIFKDHEMHLLRTVLKNSSPPAWEHRELCPPPRLDSDSAVPVPEHTPQSYLRGHRSDYHTVSALKASILERCQSFLRPATVSALKSKVATESSDVDDALWRLWTFCKIFGSDKGREEDVAAQMDWLDGGIVFHQKTCDATLTANAFDVGGVLGNAPDTFAMGNVGGLSAEQLLDMTEMWNCLSVLLQGILGHTEEAHQHGIYDSTGVREGDVDGEEHMLEEWQYYLLTLGLDTILEVGTTKPDSLFAIASMKGWTTWSPPANGGSRATFIKEALARTYEKRITTVVPAVQQEAKEQKKEAHKAHIANLQSEIRHRKQLGDTRQVTMSMERPMSEWESMVDHLIAQSPSIMDSPTLGRNIPPVPSLPFKFDKAAKRASKAAAHPLKQVNKPSYPALSSVTPQPPKDNLFHQQLPFRQSNSTPVTQTSRGQIHSHPVMTNGAARSSTSFSRPLSTRPDLPVLQIHTDHNPLRRPTMQKRVSNQHPLQRDIASRDPATNTADKAIYRIVEMGFTAEQAKHALKVTDMGDGLRIDRAVELLLRESK
ncbi:hypothetical protein EJ05DRAFT_480357 [Pseudovirgaria hyperparasitica]|uniref:UBA domain-containing protein n=1 Tax=Pseudovirgaria hyperparasitica TaxID=470096 RepID=A0A6A6VVR1_9PEZI|nr:uncharacterized protein EJ05DRAFT_480357 [Pseudovirgaria hyperparasitica]KAF2753337.1 hypothetical protein EJ05DRAFT_480357 [Pseudovirgaria hyperparasitica]